MKKLLFCLSLFLALLSTRSFADLNDFNIYFINGMNASPRDAKDSRDKLRSLVLPDVPDGNVLNLYQNNDTALREMVETVRQQASADNQRQVYKNLWKCVFDPVTPAECGATTPRTPKSLRRIINETLARYDQAAYVQFPQLQSMVSTARDNYYNKRKKTLLVAHSQGNFYANQLVNYLESFDPAVAACVEVVGVASPATYVAKLGPYDTRDDDAVINAARADFPWGGSILPPTWISSDQVRRDPSGHTFVASYLGPATLRQRIRNAIDLQAVPVAECVFPQVCKTLRASGGDGRYYLTHFLGSGARMVNVRLDMNGGSGSYLNGEISAISDQGAGVGTLVRTVFQLSQTFSFRFDPGALYGAKSISLLFDAIGGSNWNWCVDCGDGTSCQ